VVAQVEKVLVRHGDETLVQDGEPAHARVEDPDRPLIHAEIVETPPGVYRGRVH
jgi:hypothetical protein